MSSLHVINPEAIANLQALSEDDGGEFLREILSIYLQDTPQRIAELHAAITSGDVPVFSRAAHTIKGSSSNVGAEQVRAVAEQLEHDSKAGAALPSLAPHVGELEAAFNRATAEINKLV